MRSTGGFRDCISSVIGALTKRIQKDEDYISCHNNSHTRGNVTSVAVVFDDQRPVIGVPTRPEKLTKNVYWPTQAPSCGVPGQRKRYKGETRDTKTNLFTARRTLCHSHDH